MKSVKYLGLVLTLIGLALPRAAAAQGKTFKGENFEITFQTAGWDTIKNANILAKLGGLYGMATLGVTPSATLPNLDSLTAAYADTLGGKITKDSSGKMNL